MGKIGRTIERERKYRLTQEEAARLRAELRRVGTHERTENQENVLLVDRATRLKKGTLLRIRTVDGRRELTFKAKKRQEGLDKTRDELTVAIGDGPLDDILMSLGLVPGLRYLKECAIFSFKGVIVSVDRVPDIGWFCEIEADDLTSDLGAIADELGLTADQFESRGYPSMAAEAGLSAKGA
ncbi:MAG TPA: class IV adenylate cyclase [Candidatus Limnocylindria bacterium]|jgi:predicted adenylyl cyclase CyaB